MLGARELTTDVPAQQRRILRVLVGAQILSGAGLSAGITVGALLAEQMLASTALAGLPSALFTIGSAAAAVLIGRASQAGGRRVGLTAGYAVGALGALGVVGAALLDSAVLLFVALFVYGAGSATNLQARYAGADLAEPARRGRAVSTVLVATTLGGVIGPNLTAVTGTFAESFGIPRLAGPFLLAALAYAAAALVLGLLLRPDPLLRAYELAGSEQRVSAEAGRVSWRGPVLLAASVMLLTQLVMVAVMTMTPVHIAAHGHGVGAAGLVIALHVAAMYLPSPVSGWLADRFGRVALAAAAGVTLLASGVLAGLAPGDSVPLLAVALILLGLGWNFGLVSGTAMITDAVPLANRARIQGTVDVGIAVAGAGGGLGGGFVVAATGYPTLALAGGVIALAVLPIIALTTGNRALSTKD